MPVDCRSLLVVDVDQDFLDILCGRLYRLGYHVTPVTHPRRALAAASMRRYDIALLGWNLGEESGLELIKHLTVRVPRQRVILLSSDDGSQKEALAAGAFACLSPPCSFERIEDMLEAVSNFPEGRPPYEWPPASSVFVEI